MKPSWRIHFQNYPDDYYIDVKAWTRRGAISQACRIIASSVYAVEGPIKMKDEVSKKREEVINKCQGYSSQIAVLNMTSLLLRNMAG